MKKSLLVSLISVGSLVIVASSFGQGSVNFQNYDFGGGSLNAPVTYINTSIGVGKEFTADLLYSLDDGTTFNLLTAGQSGNSNYPTHFAFGVGNDGDAANFAGYFFGDVVTIPGYTSGAVSFQIEAYNGSSYFLSSIAGRSAVFSMSSLTTGTTPPSNFTGLAPFVVGIPEPTAFALAGIGAAALMIVRRKK